MTEPVGHGPQIDASGEEFGCDEVAKPVEFDVFEPCLCAEPLPAA